MKSGYRYLVVALLFLGPPPGVRASFADHDPPGTVSEEAAASSAQRDLAVAHLSRPAPNPSPGGVRFTILLPEERDVDLAIFDLGGRRVASLWSGRLAAGERTFRWDGAARSGERVRPGLYAVRLRAGSQVAMRLVTLLR